MANVEHVPDSDEETFGASNAFGDHDVPTDPLPPGTHGAAADLTYLADLTHLTIK